MYYKRIEESRFHPRIFLREGFGFRSMRWDELVLLMEGISPKVARLHRYTKEVESVHTDILNAYRVIANVRYRMLFRGAPSC